MCTGVTALHWRHVLNHFCAGKGPCAANLHKWGLASSEKCGCGVAQTMLRTVNEFPKTVLPNVDWQRLQYADDSAINWLEHQWKQLQNDVDATLLLLHTLDFYVTSLIIWNCSNLDHIPERTDNWSGYFCRPDAFVIAQITFMLASEVSSKE